MKILSKIARVPGEEIDLRTKVYKFSRDEAGRFYLDVHDPEHIGTLLAIRDAFLIHPDEVGAVPVAEVVQAPAKPVQIQPAPVDQLEPDDDDEDGKDAAPQAPSAEPAAEMTIEQLRAEYLRVTGNPASPKAPAHILRKQLAFLAAKASAAA